MSILGRGTKRKSKVPAGYRDANFEETLRGMGYSHLPVLLTAADVKKLLGRIPTTLENMTACGEQGFYRAKDVEPLWWKI